MYNLIIDHTDITKPPRVYTDDPALKDRISVLEYTLNDPIDGHPYLETVDIEFDPEWVKHLLGHSPY
jgi:hypothetical protein